MTSYLRVDDETTKADIAQAIHNLRCSLAHTSIPQRRRELAAQIDDLLDQYDDAPGPAQRIR